MSLATDRADPIDRHHNQPPLKERLTVDYQALLDEAEAIASRANDAPKEVLSDADLGPIGAVVKDARALRLAADGQHKEEKRPYLDAGKDVDAFFAGIIDRMQRIQGALEARATIFHQAKEAAARRAKEEEARKLREEEARKREIAEAEAARNRPTASTNKTAEADKIADMAKQAEADARVPTAELTRVRTDDGIVASTTTKWAGEIVDYDQLDLNQLRHNFTRADVEKAVRAYVKVHRDTKPLAGVRIYPDSRATFR